MRTVIDESWFSDLIGTILSKKYSDDSDYTKYDYSLVYNKVHDDVRAAVQEKYGEYANNPRKLTEDTNLLLEIYLPQYGVNAKRK